MPTNTMKVEKARALATIAPSTWNAEKRTLDVIVSTGAAVRRYDWWNGGFYDEELVIEEGAIRMERLNAGAAVLNTHGQWDLGDQIGVVERAWIEGGKLMATLRLSAREDIAGIVQDIADGIIRNISVGYVPHVYETIENAGQKIPTKRAIDWEPTEVSFVPVPADSGAQARSAQPPHLYTVEVRTRDFAAFAPPAAFSGTTQEEQRNMDENEQQPQGGAAAAAPQPTDSQARAAERTRIAEITKAVRAAGLDESFGQDLIDRDVPLDQARALVINKMAERDAQTPTRNVNPAASLSVIRDEGETRTLAMGDALYLRMSPNAARTMKPEALERAREYRHMSLLRMAEESLERSGVRVRGMTPLDIATHVLRAQSTSDFPNLLSNLAHRRLREAYEANPGTYQRWARRAPNAPDFKSINVIQVGAVPAFAKVNEGGELKYGKITDGATSYAVFSYYSGIAFTRQAIINDDLRGFDQALRGFAAAGNRLENGLVYAQLTSNPTMPDGTALFHAAHGNLAAAAAIAVASLGEGRKLMREQKGLQGEVLNLTPAYLIVPAALEQLAYQYTSSQFVPAKSSDINEFRQGGRTALEPIVEPILDATSASQWYMAASNNSVDTVEYCWLEGSEGVYTESMVDFDTDGIKIKARDDFGAKVVDHRGLFRNG